VGVVGDDPATHRITVEERVMDGTLCDFSGEVEGEKGAGPEIHSNKNCECERVCVCVCVAQWHISFKLQLFSFMSEGKTNVFSN